jgi:deoxycytidylate deaminase
MNAVVKNIAEVNSGIDSDTGDDNLMSKFASRQSNEIVIAFAGPIGCGIKSVINATKRSLSNLGYESRVIKLSELLDESITAARVKKWDAPVGSSVQFSRYRRLQEAGKELRQKSGNKHLLAEYAVQRIVLERESISPSQETIGAEPVPARTAYLIDQVKRPEEVELLRALYRNLFYLVGVTKPYQQRRRLLEDDGVDEKETEGLMEIDRSEEGDWGQKLDRTLHLADFFVRNDFAVDQRGAVERFIRLIHGDKSLTPDHVETGMYAAYAAGLRSACLSRQVGAAIADRTGQVIATGCNDVPAPTGGLYSTSSSRDFRCVSHGDKDCRNDRHKRRLKEDIGRVISTELAAKAVALKPELLEELLSAIYKQTRLGSLIEFSRSVHAEMDAIVSLARTGCGGIRGATLFTTTFPCHSCARHIVAAGITDVFYIEPYEKSMAQELHEDAIVFEVPGSAEAEGDLADHNKLRVKFLHFEGVAPRLFAIAFRADDRKDRTTGRFIPISQHAPVKILPEYMDNYKDFERAAVKHFNVDLERVVSRDN